MAAAPVTPIPGLVSQVTTGGTPVTVVAGGPNGGFITNPANAPGSLFVDPVGAAAVVAGGTTFELAPGQTWSVIAGQTTPTSVNSNSSAHQFSAVSY